jgi:hypothetical protein
MEIEFDLFNGIQAEYSNDLLSSVDVQALVN